MKNYSVVTFLMLIGFALQAQSYCAYDEDFDIHKEVPGYIITNEGDTIKGQIKVQTRAKSQIKVKFTSDNGKSKTYKSKHLIGYGYRTGSGPHTCSPYRYRHFLRKTAAERPRPFTSKVVFMEVRAAGKAVLYSYFMENDEKTGLLTISSGNIYLHYYYLEFKDGSRARKITQDNFDWAIPPFLEECQDIIKLFQKDESILTYHHLEELVEVFNNCASRVESCNHMTEEMLQNQQNK